MRQVLAKLHWYYHRLKSMSPVEISWRIQSQLSEILDLIKILFGWVPRESLAATTTTLLKISTIKLSQWDETPDDKTRQWKKALTSESDQIIVNNLTFFNLDNQHLGNPIDWQKDHHSLVTAPLWPIIFVDYRNANRFGDCKLIWEPNRHHQLVILGRAFRATGDEKYAEGVINIINSWIDQNPYGYGMNWRSPLELGVRIINWCWALDLICCSSAFQQCNLKQIRASAYQHCYDITHKYSQGTSANNHLIGEAAGVFVAASFFSFNENWVNDSKQILEAQITIQSYEDGCTRELATGYQYFVLQFYLAAGIVGLNSDNPFSSQFVNRYKLMIKFLAQLSKAGDIPLFCDADDGYVLDFGSAHEKDKELSCMSRIFDDPLGFDQSILPNCETEFWLGLPGVNSNEAALASIGFTDSGYYLLQSSSEMNASVVFDCGPLGYTNIAAHGHADALSLIFRLNSQNILIDPGTYDYFSYPDWRNYFKSTRAHNTIEIDGQDQSIIKGLFMWDEHAVSICERWEPTSNGGRIEAKHTGYLRLEDPVIHRRMVDLQNDKNQLVIDDTIECNEQHTIRLHFHFDSKCKLRLGEDNTLNIQTGTLQLTMQLSTDLRLTLVEGSDDSFLGWQSPGYHARLPTTTLVAEQIINGKINLKTTINWGKV